ncbi:MAG: DUF1732 domain-containing protein [SAR86 cluster bacterium]|nr:DUF1732 domain-containing protein [SAR86 cluster bacterium]MDA0899705.1 DUF1732 domain-containing protein [Pseudomonadota bacterium]
MIGMTGFTEVSHDEKGIQYKCIGKSLNSRFLEVAVKLPSNLKGHEGWVRNEVQKMFTRGKVEIELYAYTSQDDQLKVSESLARKVKKNEDELRSKGVEFVPISYFQLLKLKDSLGSSSSLSAANFKKVIRSTLKNLVDSRLQDGNTTKKDLESVVKKMQKHVNKITKYEKKNSEQVFKKYNKYKKELNLKNSEVNYPEIFAAISKFDINEEVVRLISHLDQVDKLIKSKGQVGKKLDFFTQELLRETNTITSKASISHIKLEAVELKSLIERVKEHAQNVE